MMLLKPTSVISTIFSDIDPKEARPISCNHSATNCLSSIEAVGVSTFIIDRNTSSYVISVIFFNYLPNSTCFSASVVSSFANILLVIADLSKFANAD